MFDQLIREHYERAAQDPAGRFDFDGVKDLERIDERDVRNYVRDVVTRVLRPRDGAVRPDQDLFVQGSDRYANTSPLVPVCNPSSQYSPFLA
jgi:hypothetical protein